MERPVLKIMDIGIVLQHPVIELEKEIQKRLSERLRESYDP
jgi:hypothetical protein